MTKTSMVKLVSLFYGYRLVFHVFIYYSSVKYPAQVNVISVLSKFTTTFCPEEDKS